MLHSSVRLLARNQRQPPPVAPDFACAQKTKQEMPISETLERIIGECGTEITFRVIHQNAKSPVDITLKRGTPIYWYCTRPSAHPASLYAVSVES
jgi:hypothetical protein